MSTGVASPDCVICAAKMFSAPRRVALVHVLEDHEEQRQDHDQPQAEIGALLRDELAQLPAVDRQRRGRRARACAERAAAAWRGADGRAAHRPRSPAQRALPGRAVAAVRRRGVVCAVRARRLSRAPLPSVRRKKRSSSVASSGVSARIPIARARERQRQLADGVLLGLEDEPVLAAGGVLDARLRAHERQRAAVVGRAQPVARARPGGADRRARPRRRRARSRRSRRGRTVPAPRAAGGLRAAP